MRRPGSVGRPLAYTPEEAAELLRVSPSLIRSLVRTGALPRVAGLGRAVRIPSRALYEFVGEPVPDLSAAIEIEPAEVPEPRPPAPERTPPPVRAPVVATPRPVRRPAAPRPRPPAPEGPIRVGDQRLWLLGDSSQYRRLAWHIGVDEAVCGRKPGGRWKRSASRSPGATMCPSCLTAVGRMTGVEMSSIPIGTVCMVRETRRGDSVALIKTGWHLGNGRVTTCGERRRWEHERARGSFEAERAGKPGWTVLVDHALGAAEVEDLARRVPGFVALRRASRSVTPEDFEQYDRALQELFGGAQVVPGTSAFSSQWAPDVTVTAGADVLAAAQGNRGVMTSATFAAWATPIVEREEKSRVLRARWDKGAAADRGRAPRTSTPEQALLRRARVEGGDGA